MLEFVIPCLLGLESLVGDEIRKLGLSDVRVENGRVLCRGEARDIARLNINLRCGARVILVLHKFRATDFESLFQGVRAVHWEDWIPREGEFPVVGYSINSTLHSVPACQSIVKKAVVDRLSAAYGIAQFPETGRRYQVRFSIMKDEVTVGLDTSGEGLYKRGYRAHGVAAPLKETLAAAMVKLSHYNGRDPFCDPFCGSGTIAIEAALIARNRAPGLNRSFAAQHWATLDKMLWLDAADEAMDKEFHGHYDIWGGDVDPRAVAIARDNARKAGVEDVVRFEVAEGFVAPIGFAWQPLPLHGNAALTQPSGQLRRTPALGGENVPVACSVLVHRERSDHAGTLWRGSRQQDAQRRWQHVKLVDKHGGIAHQPAFRQPFHQLKLLRRLILKALGNQHVIRLPKQQQIMRFCLQCAGWQLLRIGGKFFA